MAQPVVRWLHRSKPGVKTPLVVLLHGRGADEHDLFGVAEILPRRFACASVRAPLAALGGGYTWFESRGAARPIAASLRASVADLRAWLATAAPELDRPCFLLGFSAGMMMAGALLLDDPQRFAGAVLLSGALPLDSGLPVLPGRLSGMSIFCGLGLHDDVIPAPLVDRSMAYLRAVSGATVSVHEYPHGHAISKRELDDIAAWFDRHG